MDTKIGGNNGKPEPFKSGTLSPPRDGSTPDRAIVPGDKKQDEWSTPAGDEKQDGWSSVVKRMVILSTIEGDLLTVVPGAFSPDLFNPQSKSPNSVIAKVVCDYFKQYGSKPTAEIVTAEIGDDEAVQETWREVQATELPDDPAWVYDTVRKAIEYRRLETALLEARMTLESQGADGLTAAREALAKATAITTTGSVWTTYTADELDTLDIPARGFVVEVMMPQRGVQWRGGAPKRGKSLYTLYECLAITSGRDTVAGRFKILERPKILYVAREDADFRVQDRQRDILSAWGASPPGDNLRYLIQQKIDLLNPADVARLRDLCVLESRTVLVLDTWTALSPGADPMGAETQAKLAAVVVQLAIDIGGLVIVVDHTRKNRPDGMPLSAAEILGPSQKWQSADHVVMLDRKPQSSRYEFYVEGRDLDDEQRFILERSSRGSKVEKFNYAGSVEGMVTAAVEKGDTNRQRILRIVVEATQPVTSAEVLRAVNAMPGQEPLSDRTVKRHLTALFDGGWLDRMGKGPGTRYRPLRAPGESDEIVQSPSSTIVARSENPQ